MDARNRIVAEAATKHWRKIQKYALSFLGDAYQAEDVCQETFLTLLLSRKQFASEAHLEFWLIKVAKNKCRNIHRARKRTSEMPIEPDSLNSIVPDKNEDIAGQSPIWEEVDQLSETHRKLLRLFYIEGYSTEEIAAMTRTMHSTVRTRLHRARCVLKKRLLSIDAYYEQWGAKE